VRQRDFPGEPLALYGSGWKTGMNDDFHTFGGEWLRDSEWVAKPEASEYDGEWNAEKTVQWNSALQNAVVWVNWTQSLIDQYVWYYDKFLRLSDINGTWWDDGGLGTCTDWDAHRGKFVNQWWFLKRRELCKRLNVIQAQLGRQPLWITNQHVDFSWSQIAWHIEEIFYGSDTKVKGYFGVLTPDQFRAVTCTRGGVIPRLCPRSEADLTLDEQSHFLRTAYGMAALHGIGAYMHSMQDYDAVKGGKIPLEENRIRMMLALVGAYNPGAEFIPYWRSQAFVHLKPKYAANVSTQLISIYRSPGHDKALLVIANPTDRPAEFTCTWLYSIEDSLLGRPVTQFVDADTMEELPNTTAVTAQGFTVAPYDFRFLFLE
jgi:hypothetical protein